MEESTIPLYYAQCSTKSYYLAEYITPYPREECANISCEKCCYRIKVKKSNMEVFDYSFNILYNDNKFVVSSNNYNTILERLQQHDLVLLIESNISIIWREDLQLQFDNIFNRMYSFLAFK